MSNFDAGRLDARREADVRNVSFFLSWGPISTWSYDKVTEGHHQFHNLPDGEFTESPNVSPIGSDQTAPVTLNSLGKGAVVNDCSNIFNEQIYLGGLLRAASSVKMCCPRVERRK